MESTDVLVIGSGIAGLCAAIEAARTGATVTVASAGKTMSGSSFFPGTWGLGLIGPVDEDDEQDLIDTIQTVGGGVADPELVQTFVHGIPQAIEWLEQDLGVELQRPQSAESAQQKQFIPCFDHKTRMWRGLTRKPLEDALTTRIESLGIRLLPRHELIDLVEDTNGRITGTMLYDLTENRIVPFAAKATIIATGGTGGLFERSLTSADVLSSSQAIALAHGATLTNIEFMQMMPGFIEPKRNLVFNEKTWRYVHVDQPGRYCRRQAGRPARAALWIWSLHVTLGLPRYRSRHRSGRCRRPGTPLRLSPRGCPRVCADLCHLAARRARHRPD